MKTNKLTLYLSIIYLVLFSSVITAQELNIKGRWNFKFTYSRVESNIGVTTKQEIKSNYGIEVNYGIFKTIEPNIFYSITISDFIIHHYGLGLNYQLLPHFIEANDFRFDLYIAAKIGQFKVSDSNWHDWEYGIGPGLNFYLLQNLGLFTEFSFGKYFFEDNNRLRFGLSYKF